MSSAPRIGRFEAGGTRGRSGLVVLALLLSGLVTLAPSPVRAASGQPAMGVVNLPQTVRGSWSEIGPRPTQDSDFGATAGLVTSLVVDPSNSSVVFAGTAGGGVWKSTDGGANWGSRTDQLPSLAIGALAMDPTNHGVVYAATGSLADGGRQFGAGIYRSADGGDSWSVLGSTDSLFYGRSIHQLIVTPQSPQALIAATDTGISRSTDGGASWVSTFAFRPLPGYGIGVADLALDPANPANVYAGYASSGRSGILRSTDGGSNWAPLAVGLPASGTASRISIAIAPGSSARLYAVVAGTDRCLQGMYRTDDGGASWSNLNAPEFFNNGSQCQGEYDNYVAVDPASPDTAYIGGIDIWKLTGAGSGFTNLTNWSRPPFKGHVHPDQHALVFTASSLYAGNDGGVWSSGDGGKSFRNLNGTFGTALVYYGSAERGRALAGLQDNGIMGYQGGVSWSTISGGDGSGVAVDWSNPSNQYVSLYNPLDVFRSTDGGASFTAAQAGIDPADVGGGRPDSPLVMDANDSRTLVAASGDGKVYRTTDGASTWTAISGNLTPGGAATGLAIAPRASSEIWYGAAGPRVFVTTSTGGGWVERSAGLPAFTEARAFAIDAANSQHVFVALARVVHVPGVGSVGGVFESTDLGATWTDVSGGLGSLPVNALALDGGGRLFAGTDQGVFARVGGAWGRAGDSMPRARVTDLELSHDGSALLASSYGRGLWELPVGGTVAGAPRPWTGGSDAVGVAAGATDAYFAEGYTGPNFKEYLTVENAGGAQPLTVQYLLASGQVLTKGYSLAQWSRTTIDVNADVGYNQEVSAHLSAPGPFIAERPMYFTFAGGIPGGHDVMGAQLLGTSFYFAEGFTGFQEYLTLMNADVSATANVQVTYFFNGVPAKTVNHSIGPHSRQTVNVDDPAEAGPGRDVSIRVTSDLPVLAERPIYFNFLGRTGGEVVVGAPAPLQHLNLAEGFVGPGFDEYLSVLNPGAAPANITISYYLGSGSPRIQTLTVPAASRQTVHVNDVLPANTASSVHIDSDQGVVVERPMYFTYPKGNGGWKGGHDAVAVSDAALGRTFNFAEGFVSPSFDEYLTILNRNGADAHLTITYYLTGGGTSTRAVTVPPFSRFTESVSGDLPPFTASSVQITSDQPVLAERPMYFSY